MSKIVEFMRHCLSYYMMPLSWGIYDIRVSNSSMCFFVNGSKYQGEVMIKECNKKIIVWLASYEAVFLDVAEALRWLDNKIE